MRIFFYIFLPLFECVRVISSDLHAVTDGNALCKYADDLYIIFPAVNVDSLKMSGYNLCPQKANSKLLCARHHSKTSASYKWQKLSASLFDKRPISIIFINIMFSDIICTACVGLCENALQIIFRVVLVAKLMYGSSAWWQWWGFASVTHCTKLKLIFDAIRKGFLIYFAVKTFRVKRDWLFPKLSRRFRTGSHFNN